MELTPKQEAFAQHYAVYRHAAQAYRHAYNVRKNTKEATVNDQASKILANPDIAQRIGQIIAAATNPRDNPAVMDLKNIAERLCNAIASDPNELSTHRVGACRYCWGVDHKYHWKQHEYLHAVETWERLIVNDPKAPMPDPAGGFGYRFSAPQNPDCPACEGEGLRRVLIADTTKLSPGALQLYGGVKQKRGGEVELIIADRVKLFDMLIRMQGGYQDNVRLGGQFGAIVAAVKASDSDPEAAAKLYMEMVQAVALK